MLLEELLELPVHLVLSPAQDCYGWSRSWEANIIATNFFLETNVQQANAKAQVVVNHLASFLSSREEISQPGIGPSTSSLRFGYLSNSLGLSWTNYCN